MEIQNEIDNETWLALSQVLQGSDLLSVEFAKLNCWKVAILDDNNLEDPDVDRLEQAISALGHTRYFSLPTSDLGQPFEERRVISYRAGKNDWSEFFDFGPGDFLPYIEDTVFFSSPIDFLVLRTGHTRHTIFAGPKEFVELCVGESLNDRFAISFGDNWPDNRVETIYSPERLPGKLWPQG